MNADMARSKLLSASEVSKHNSGTDCWIVVDGQVWDITGFAPDHPGGPGIIYKYAGRDATKPYSAIHAPSIIREGLPAAAFKGTLDPSTTTPSWSQSPVEDSLSPAKTHSSTPEKPPLESLINAADFELAARHTSSPKTWAFYSSADTGLVTRNANASLYSRIWFRPRIMRDVTHVSTQSTILSHPVALPLMVAPAAMARLIHPDGELAIARACATKGIIQCISTAASYTAVEIASAAPPTHPFIFQLYVDRQRSKSAALLHRLRTHAPNIRAVYVTVDAAAAGKREADERVRADESLRSPMVAGNKATNDKKGGGLGRIMGSFIDPGLCWEDVAWLREQTKDLPLLLKGVMAADDVKRARDAGLDGVVLSNHGGRNLDTAPPPILVLLECHRRFPEIFSALSPSSAAEKCLTAQLDLPTPRTKKFEIHIDGGIRRGTDILKCLCLGATAVAIGRSFLYATAYGQGGVEHLVDVLHDELRVAMANVGIARVEDAGPHLVNTGDIDHLVPVGEGHPYVRDWRVGRRARLEGGRARL